MFIVSWPFERKYFSMASSLSLLFDRNMIFRLKTKQRLFEAIILNNTILCMTRGNLHVETPVLQSEIYWFIRTLNLFVLLSIAFPLYVSFPLHMLISNNIWHWLSGSHFSSNLTIWHCSAVNSFKEYCKTFNNVNDERLRMTASQGNRNIQCGMKI